MEFVFAKELTARQNEFDMKLYNQIIENLKPNVKDIETSLKELSQKSVTAETTNIWKFSPMKNKMNK